MQGPRASSTDALGPKLKLQTQRGWSLCEIMEQAGAGFHKPGQQQRILFPVEAGQDEYIKEICSPEGLIFKSLQSLKYYLILSNKHRN